MAWVKLDDQFFINRKAVAVGLEGRALFIASVCYSAMQRNDGLIPEEAQQVIAAMAGVPIEVGVRLLDEGMWHPEGTDCAKCRTAGQAMPVPSGHIAVHEFLRENPSREQVNARRERAEKAAAARHGKPSPGDATSSASSRPPGTPSPSPSPPPSDPGSHHPGNSRGTSPPVDDDEHQQQPVNPDDLAAVPAETWEHYAQLMTDRQPSGKVRDRASYVRKAKANAKKNAELVATAARWARGFEDITPRRLAECLVDGKPPRDLPFTVPESRAS